MTSPSSPFFSISRSNASSVSVPTPFPLSFRQQPAATSILLPCRPTTLLPHLKLYHSSPPLRHFHPASATASSYASDEDDETPKLSESSDLPEMARALGVSSRVAYAACACLVLAALSVPLVMRPVTSAASAKIRALSYVTLLSGFYMAWNIGANDVANAMGTSVGSGALSLLQAVVIASVLEFSGALLMGTHVTNTMQKGILVASVFHEKDSLLFAGLLSSLAASGTWLQMKTWECNASGFNCVANAANFTPTPSTCNMFDLFVEHRQIDFCYSQVASFYGWPVSTTHCIVGAMVGFGLVYGGIGAVFWSSLARVASSWVISPVMGAAASFIVYKCIRRFVYSADNPGQAAAAAAPVAVFLGVTGISFAAFPHSKIIPIALVQALACGSIGAFIVNRIIHKQLGHLLSSEAEKPVQKDKLHLENISFLADIAGPKGAQLEIVYGVFGYMQVLSACFMSFAHGGNDVSNAIGPLAAALSILQGGMTGTEIVIPKDVLAWGGFGIVAGLMMWGHRVIATIGKKITELTPTRGFAAEFAAASVVLVASKLGLPISATHTLVGAVMGVGFARGLNSVRAETVREIVTSWVVTIPVGAFLSVIYTLILTKLLPNFI
ncbi:Inorganic phosphate transporter 2-1, chloroplastic [Dendrobium catenatum]|uniref:Phosphate transporter n=1 Tax=Dendrobium catenatum TaxID=906689 RepID=A0A2I0WYX7_9ASPA|nr:Inorganic phosphate transporter 2-1, chloroplastic [Dendrobium catenatum]